MPRYFFSLTETAWPHQPGEELFDDEEARRYAELVAAEVGRNSDERPRIRVFEQSGRRLA